MIQDKIMRIVKSMCLACMVDEIPIINGCSVFVFSCELSFHSCVYLIVIRVRMHFTIRIIVSFHIEDICES